MFEKKFKVRVKHFSQDYYQVEYAYYRIFPDYKSLNFWFDQGVTGSTECWSTKLFKYNEAEELAKTLKTYDDVLNWYKPWEEERTDFYKRKREYYKKNVPYTTKYFN